MQLAHFVADEFITKPKSGCFGTAATPHSGKQKKDDRNQDRNSQPASLARSLHPAAKPQKPSNSTLDLGLEDILSQPIDFSGPTFHALDKQPEKDVVIVQSDFHEQFVLPFIKLHVDIST